MIKGPKRELVFQENITGPVPSAQNYVVPTEFGQKLKKKKELVPQSTKDRLKKVSS